MSVINRVVNKLSQGVRNESASRARVVCHTEHTHTGIGNTWNLSDHARVRARAIPAALVAAWRDRIFADGIEDPVKAAVWEAVKDFGGADDFTIWAWYANRIGVNSFLELYFEQMSIMRTCVMRNPAAAFHMRLKRFYAALTDGGAERVKSAAEPPKGGKA